MIKFFRKIRQRLLSENSFSKYMLYAIGEIALVVIGILIALQMNNWNEQRKLNMSNDLFKQKLVGELELNIQRLSALDSSVFQDGVNYGLKNLIENSDTAIQLVQEGLDTVKINWLLKSNLFLANSLNLHSSIYEEMKNTGRLYSLGSDSLIHAIDKYYRRIEREEFYNNGRNERATNSWDDCKYGFESFRIDYSYSPNLAYEKHGWLFDSDSKNYQDLKIALNHGRSAMNTNRRRLLELIEDSKNVISWISAEMESPKP